MKRSPKKVQKTVTVLTDPHPMFNSIVRAGANGTPLRVIKTEEPQETEMPTNLKNGNADIARLVFRGEKFKSEDQVQAWLTAGNYSETVIKAEDDGSFSVAGDATITEPHEIEVEDGVTAFVGEGTDPVDDTTNRDVASIEGQKTETPQTGAQKADDELRAKAEEKVRTDARISEDDWKALKQETRDKFTAPVLAAMKAEAETSVQPVATETATDATVVAPEKPSDILPAMLVKSESGLISVVAQKGIYELEQLAEIIRSLNWLKEGYEYDAYTGNASPEYSASIRTAIKTLGEVLIQVASAHVEQASKSEEAPAQTDTAPTAGVTQEEVEAAPAATAETATKEASNSDPAQNALLEAIQALTTKVTGMETSVKEANARAEQSAKTADTLAERLAKVEGTTQTRKSADVDEIKYVSPIHHEQKTAQKSASEISAEVRHKSSMSAMGIRT